MLLMPLLGVLRSARGPNACRALEECQRRLFQELVLHDLIFDQLSAFTRMHHACRHQNNKCWDPCPGSESVHDECSRAAQHENSQRYPKASLNDTKKQPEDPSFFKVRRNAQAIRSRVKIKPELTNHPHRKGVEIQLYSIRELRIELSTHSLTLSISFIHCHTKLKCKRNNKAKRKRFSTSRSHNQHYDLMVVNESH